MSELIIFSEWLSNQKMSPKTIYEYIKALNRFASWFESSRAGPFDVKQIDQDVINDYISYMRFDAKLSAAYINKNLAALRKWLFYLQTQGLWPYPINLPDVVTQQAVTAPKSLQPHEIRAVLYAIDRENNDFLRARDRCMIYLALYRGFRNEEQLLLEMNDVILKPGRESIIIRSGKGGKYAEIDIRSSKKIISAIHDWIEERAKSVYASSPMFFISRRSGSITWGTISKMVKRLSKRSGVEFTMHQLRHTFGHDLLKITSNLRLVQQLLRHSHVKTTEIYTLQHPSEIHDALRRLDQFY